MDFWTYVAAALVGWAVLLCGVGLAADRTIGRHERIVEVRCDRCDGHTTLVVTSPTSRHPSESRWDVLTVERLREMGWGAGVEPARPGSHITPDVCPDCRGER